MLVSILVFGGLSMPFKPGRRTEQVPNSGIVQLFYFIYLFFFFLEDMSPFCGATDAPALDLW